METWVFTRPPLCYPSVIFRFSPGRMTGGTGSWETSISQHLVEDELSVFSILKGPIRAIGEMRGGGAG